MHSCCPAGAGRQLIVTWRVSAPSAAAEARLGAAKTTKPTSVPELVIEALEDPVVLALELTVFEAVCVRGGTGA